MKHERAAANQYSPPPLAGQVDHRRRHRWLRKEHPTASLAQVARIKMSQGLFHRMELFRAGQGHDQAGEEEQESYPDDVQSAACHRFREPPLSRDSAAAQ